MPLPARTRPYSPLPCCAWYSRVAHVHHLCLSFPVYLAGVLRTNRLRERSNCHAGTVEVFPVWIDVASHFGNLTLPISGSEARQVSSRSARRPVSASHR